MEQFENDIINCIAAMESGGTFLYPTDTIWGLGCDATNEKAIDKISELKNRPTNKSYIVLMPNVQMLREHLKNPIDKLEDFINQQSGATTIIYDRIRGIAPNALAADGSLGIRIPKDNFCLALLKHYGKPIISTSANLSGESNPSFHNEISETVKERVEYVCDWRRNDIEPKQPSNIIKLNADGTSTKIR